MSAATWGLFQVIWTPMDYLLFCVLCGSMVLVVTDTHNAWNPSVSQDYVAVTYVCDCWVYNQYTPFLKQR